MCVKCSFGFYFNDLRVCTKIPDECRKYDIIDEECDECYIGYSLVNNTCLESDEDLTDKYCKEWKDNVCLECSQGSFLNVDNFCKLVNPLCKTYNRNNGFCTSCYPGFTLIRSGC